METQKAARRRLFAGARLIWPVPEERRETTYIIKGKLAKGKGRGRWPEKEGAPPTEVIGALIVFGLPGAAEESERDLRIHLRRSGDLRETDVDLTLLPHVPRQPFFDLRIDRSIALHGKSFLLKVTLTITNYGLSVKRKTDEISYNKRDESSNF